MRTPGRRQRTSARRTVDLTPPGSATGEVGGQAFVGGAPAVGHAVALESVLGTGAMRRQGDVAANGSFRVDGVVPGDYEARLLEPGTKRVIVAVPCRVRAGNATVVALVAP
jgi:hypothetical protein